jgi:hypothetical protein
VIYAIVAMAAMCGIASLAVDYGRVQTAKTELCNVADAAARYAVTGVRNGTAVTKGVWIGSQHQVDGAAFTLPASAVEVGRWDPAAGAFNATSADPNAVRVTVTRSAANGNAISLTWASVLGRSSQDVTVSSVAFYNLNVMLVVGSTSLNAADTAVRDRLVSRGYNVVVRDSNFSTTEANEMLLVVVSETCASAAVGSRCNALVVPVINYEPYVVDDMLLAGPTADTNFGLSSVANRVTIDQPTHPIAAGLSGSIYVSTLPDSQPNAGLGWAQPAGGGVTVASVYGETGRAAVACWDTGAALYGGATAPARRVQLWGSGPNATWLGGVPASAWSANGWLIFDAAVNWAIGTAPTIKTVKG